MRRYLRAALLTGTAGAGAGVPCNMVPDPIVIVGKDIYRNGHEISGVWFDESEEIFRGLEAQAFCDDLAAELAGGDPF